MKATLKIFHEQNRKYVEKINNTLKLLQAPITFMTDKEIVDLRDIFYSYSQNIEKLKSQLNNK